jgi:type 1 glutamine amidotransferase
MGQPPDTPPLHDPAPASILLVTRGLFHPHPFARRALEKILRNTPGCRVSVSPSLEKIPGTAFGTSQAVVLYFHEKHISNQALAALQAYLEGGGGVLAIHAAAASYKHAPAYFELLGGKFVSHGAVQDFTITPQPPAQAILGNLPAFAIRDEFYRMETREDITVLLNAHQETLVEPFAWVRRHGRGRVCYLAAGHTTGSLQHPAVRKILQRGLLWCAGRTGAPG